MLRKIRKFYLYRKMVSAFLLINIISAIFISSALYIVFEETYKKEIYNYSIDQLVQMDSSAGKIFESLSPIINYIMASGYASSFMEGQTIDRIGEFRLMENLKVLEIANTQIQYIGVVNLTTDRYLGTRGVYSGLEEEIKNIVTQEEVKPLSCIARSVRKNENLENMDEIEVLTFVYAPKGVDSNGLVLIEVKKEYFQDLFQGKENAGKQESIFIINDQKEILFETVESGAENHMEILLDDTLYGEYKPQNYFEHNMKGTVYSVACLKSSIPEWYFVSIRSKAEMMPLMGDLLSLMIWIILIMIVVNVIITFFLAQHIYNPLGKLYRRLHDEKEPGNDISVNEIEVFGKTISNYKEKTTYLEKFRSSSSHILSANWLRSIARGELSLSEDSVLPEYLEYKLPDGYYRIILLAFEDYEKWRINYSDKDFQSIEFALSNILEELLKKYSVNEVILVEQNQYMLLIKLNNTSLPNDVLLSIQELQKEYLSYMNILINVCYGKCVYTWKEIATSYDSARRGQKKRLFLGPGVIIDAECNYGRTAKSVFPYKEVKDLGEMILLNQEEQVKRNIKKYIHKIKDMNEQNIVSYTVRASYELIQKISQEESTLRRETTDDIYDSINKINSLRDIESMLLQLSVQLMNEVMELHKKETASQSIDIVKGYIQEHYSNMDLSVEMLAGLVSLSPSYFGKLFYNTQLISCNDYVMEIRLEKAAGMLLNTKETISVISCLVGIASENYFYILFKKKYGITPAQFRKREVKDVRKKDT